MKKKPTSTKKKPARNPVAKKPATVRIPKKDGTFHPFAFIASFPVKEVPHEYIIAAPDKATCKAIFEALSAKRHKFDAAKCERVKIRKA